MFNYIKADIYRIFHNKKLWIYFGSLLLLSFVLIFYLSTKGIFSSDSERFPMMLAIAFSLSNFLIGIPLFLAIYEDDLKSQSLQFVLTTRLNKIQFILSKLITSVIMIVGFYTTLLVYSFVLSTCFSKITYDRWEKLILQGIVIMLWIFVYYSLASLFGYILQSQTFGTIIFVVGLSGAMTALLSLLTKPFPFLESIIEYTPDSLVTSLQGQIKVTSSLDIGTILLLLLYVVVASIIASIVLSKSEIKTA